jgi:hypothetical protein
MAATQVETLPDTKQAVYTKEELQALRRKLAGAGFGADFNDPTSPDFQGEPADWGWDVRLLIKFLEDLRKIMQVLVARRIPDPHGQRLASLLETLDPNIDDAIAELKTVDSVLHPLYLALKRLGLATESLAAKLDEFRDDITGRPALAVLDMGDKILGSLCKVLSQLEPLKELKETIEHRVKYGSDADIIGLGLFQE